MQQRPGYVDNTKPDHVCLLTIAADELPWLETIKNSLNQEYKMTDQGELCQVLGMKIQRNRSEKSFLISNSPKIDSFVTEELKYNHTTPQTPMEKHVTLSNEQCPVVNSSEWFETQSKLYRECVGFLTYITNEKLQSRLGICS